jgi:asparagine synthase (glutamine-hydrolysing)
MSGLFGYLSATERAPITNVLAQMGQRMQHVPHHQVEQTPISPTVGLGRIHIGRLNQHPQPVQSADGQIWLSLVGEFYATEQVRRRLVAVGQLAPDSDDTLLALALFAQAGAGGIASLNGAFTCSVWDARSGTLWIINDRYGLYPHYYAHTSGLFVFAPEMKGVIAAPGVPRRLNETALAEYVRFQQLLGEKTWLEDVHLLPPATVLRYEMAHDALTLTRYWDWDQIGWQPPMHFAEAVDEASRRFQAAIDAMISGPLRPGIFLSGGLDGRIILAFTHGRKQVPTVTFGAPGSRDAVFATQLAQRAGVPHRWFPLQDGTWILQHHALHMALTEGMHSWMHAHGISMLAAVRTMFDVNLSGWDGGCTMGGFSVLEKHEADRYYRYPPDEISLVTRLYEGFSQKTTWPGMDEGEALMLLRGAGRERLRDQAFESLRAEVARTQHYRPEHRVDYFVIEQLVRRSLQNQIITQRAAVDVRCPYFDYAFVEFMYGLPDAIRTTPQFRRALLTQRCPQLAWVPYDKDERLPHASTLVRDGDGLVRRVAGAINRRIGSFFPTRQSLYADYEQYLRNELRSWAEGILFDPRTLERGLFDPATVRSFWHQHVAGDQLWTIGKVAPLMNIELVLRQVYDE